MKISFNRKAKTKMVGIRLTESEMKSVKKMANQNGVSIAETCRVLIAAALEELSEKVIN